MEEVVVGGLAFAGQDAEGVWVVVQAVNGAVLGDDGLTDFRRGTRGMSGVLAIGGDLRFGGGPYSPVLFAILAMEAALFSAALGTF